MTESQADSERIFQGDIFKDQIIITIPPNIQILRETESEEFKSFNLEELSDAFEQKEYELTVVHAIKSNIIVLSQTCDIEHREFISIAPVFPLTKIESETKRETIRNHKFNYRFYIAASDILPESYAELTLINSIKKEILTLDKRIFSLSDYARQWLQDTLNRCFCRPFISEEKEYIEYIKPDDKIS